MKMRIPDIIIAIDGYSSTGKSSFARAIASEFSFTYLDSGAIYRALTLFAMQNGLISDKVNAEALEKILAGAEVTFEAFDGANATFLNGQCVEAQIRTLEVSNHVSEVSVIPAVRNYVDARLREYGQKGRIVMDGRDIGTAVFPKAQLKIFMVSDDKVRAERRFAEMRSKGENPSFDEVLKNLRNRDYIDSHREMNPLSRASDAYVLDNSRMTMSEELAWIHGLIQGRFEILD